MHRAPLPRSRSKNHETRLYDRGARNGGLGRGLLRQIARSGSNWLEGVGPMLGVLAAWPADRDGWIPSFQVTFIQRSSSAFHIVSEDIQKYWEMIRPQRPVIDLR